MVSQTVPQRDAAKRPHEKKRQASARREAGSSPVPAARARRGRAPVISSRTPTKKELDHVRLLLASEDSFCAASPRAVRRDPASRPNAARLFLEQLERRVTPSFGLSTLALFNGADARNSPAGLIMDGSGNLIRGCVRRSERSTQSSTPARDRIPGSHRSPLATSMACM